MDFPFTKRAPASHIIFFIEFLCHFVDFFLCAENVLVVFYFDSIFMIVFMPLKFLLPYLGPNIRWTSNYSKRYCIYWNVVLAELS